MRGVLKRYGIALALILAGLMALGLHYNGGAPEAPRRAGLLLNKFATGANLNRTSAQDQTTPAAPGASPLAGTAEPAARPQGVVHSWPNAGKLAAITFDDGPSRQFTPLYLDELDKYGVHATFFLVGRNVQENSGLAAKIAGGGNDIGCHSCYHRNLEKMDRAAAMQDIISAKQLIERDSHRQVSLFRPPGGHLNQPLIRQINEAGMKVVLWNIDPGDWYASPEKIITNVFTNLRPGSIILLHEGRAGTLAALPTLIKGIRQRGYQLVTISELLASENKQSKERKP